jgi:hypothetical protein
VLGAGGLAFWWTLPRRLPSERDWREAAALVAREAAPGDAVALAPWWAERAREVLPPGLPVLAFPRLAGEDLPGVRRVWLLSLARAPGYRGDVERDLRARGATAPVPLRAGALAIARFDLAAPSLPLAFLPDRLASAEVAVGARRCGAGAGGGFACGGAAVAREVREVDLLPRACLSARLGSGEPLRVTFPSVPLGRTLRAHLGVVGEAALGGEAPVRLVVNVAGGGAAAVEVEAEEVGWRALSLETAALAGGAAEVTLTVNAARGDARPLCVDAYTLP